MPEGRRRVSADPRLEEIHRLVASPDAPRRLFGYLRLEERLPELPLEEARHLAEQAGADADPRAHDVGKRLLAACDALSREDAFPEGGRSAFELRHAAEEDEREALDGAEPSAFGDAAEVLLGPCLDALQQLLISPKGDTVQRAVLTAGALRHPRFLPYLEELAADPEASLEVVEALDGLESERARDVLRELADSPSPARIPALTVLAAARDRAARDLLERAAADPDPEVRAAAAGGLAHDESAAARQALRVLLDDPELEVVLAAVDAWAYQQDPSAVSVLLERLQGGPEDPRLRAALLACLRDLRSPAAEDVVLQFLRDEDDRVRANAVEAMTGYEYSPEKAQRLFEPMLSDPTARVRGNAILALFLTHPPSATDALLALFDSHEAPFRRAAAYCAGMMQSQRATEKLALMMRTEQDPEVLGTGIRALQRIRDQEARDIARELADRTFGVIQVEAVHLLAELGDAAALPALARIARDAEEPGVRGAAVQAITIVSPHQGLNYLPRFLGDRDPRVVADAIEGLEASGNLEAIPLLTPLLRSDVARIRANACTALWHLGEFSALDVLRDMLTSADEGLRGSGMYALGRIGVSLRVGELARRPVLRLALAEAHRRAFPEEARAAAERRRSLEESRLDAASSGAVDRTDVAEVVGPSPEEEEDTTPEPLVDVPPIQGPDPDEAALTEVLDLVERGYGGQAMGPEDLAPEDPDAPGADTRLHLALSRALLDGDPNARRTLEEAARSSSTRFLSPLYTLAREARRAGDMGDALEFYFRLARVQVEELARLVDAGEEALQEGDPESAGRAARLLPTMLHFVPRFHALMGEFYLGRKQYRRAQEHLLRAFAAFPEEGLLALKLASAAVRDGRPRLARAAAEAARARDPDGAVGQKAAALLGRLPEGTPP